MGIRQVNSEGLDEAISSARRPLLVYFEAEGCAACEVWRPLLEQGTARCDGRLEVVRCDAWDAPSAVARLRLLSLPSVLLFVNGNEVMRLAGAQVGRGLAAVIEFGLRAADVTELAASRRSA